MKEVNILVDRSGHNIIIRAVRNRPPVATSQEVDLGTDNQKYLTSAALAGSSYRRIFLGPSEPQNPREGDLWIKTNS